MVLILTAEDLEFLDPPMSGAIEVIERCLRIQASGDATNHPRVHLPYPPSGSSDKYKGRLFIPPFEKGGKGGFLDKRQLGIQFSKVKLTLTLAHDDPPLDLDTEIEN